MLSSTFSLIRQGETKFVTYRVIPFPAFCVAGRGVDHLIWSYGPTAVRDSHMGGGKAGVGGRASWKASCSLLVRFVPTHRCMHTHSRKEAPKETIYRKQTINFLIKTEETVQRRYSLAVHFIGR